MRRRNRKQKMILYIDNYKRSSGRHITRKKKGKERRAEGVGDGMRKGRRD